jgi:hypothetical protein
VPLQLDIDAAAAEDADEAIEEAADAVPPRVEHRAPGERDQTGGAAVELVERQRPLAFGRAQLHARDQLAEVPVAFGAFAQHRQRKLLDDIQRRTRRTR